MVNTTLYVLFQLYITSGVSVEEENELMRLLADTENEEEVKTLLKEAWYEFEPGQPIFDSLQSKGLMNKVFLEIKKEKSKPNEELAERIQNVPLKISGGYYILATAAALFLVSYLAVLMVRQPVGKIEPGLSVKINKNRVNDLGPGGNKAVLTLADGRKIALDDASNGKIANQAGISITKAVDGQLVYTVSDPDRVSAQNNGQPQINTITTPRGGKYQINLPDGSVVWLNAASSLKFPTVFSEDERSVELTGEAYFEIAKHIVNHKRQSFKVVSHTGSGSQEVEVLGTHFNISAYENENSTRTTLMEGSVKVINLQTKAGKILRPGQQAIAKADDFQIRQADPEEVMAWKNGNFQFNNLKLTGIMKQVERWYDVKVDYNNIPDTRYHGFISRDVSLSQVLEMLEMTGSLKFHIENIGKSTQKEIRIEN